MWLKSVWHKPCPGFHPQNLLGGTPPKKKTKHELCRPLKATVKDTQEPKNSEQGRKRASFALQKDLSSLLDGLQGTRLKTRGTERLGSDTTVSTKSIGMESKRLGQVSNCHFKLGVFKTNKS